MLGFSCKNAKRVLSNSISTSRKWARPFHSSPKTVVKSYELFVVRSTSCAEYVSSWMHLMNCSPVSSPQENVVPFFQPFAVFGFVGNIPIAKNYIIYIPKCRKTHNTTQLSTLNLPGDIEDTSSSCLITMTPSPRYFVIEARPKK